MKRAALILSATCGAFLGGSAIFALLDFLVVSLETQDGGPGGPGFGFLLLGSVVIGGITGTVLLARVLLRILEEGKLQSGVIKLVLGISLLLAIGCGQAALIALPGVVSDNPADQSVATVLFCASGILISLSLYLKVRVARRDG